MLTVFKFCTYYLGDLPMKFLHLADLHLGKRVNGFDLLEDQRYILEQILALCDSNKVDAVVLAGDIYDAPVPPAAACTLLDWFLTQLAARRIAVLENVMNPTNIGAIFRCAAALGMDALLLSAAGSDPLYRRASRVSMGNVFLIPWTYLPEVEPWPERLRRLGFQTVAMALREDSLLLNDPRLMAAEKLAVVLGTEGDGLSDGTIAACDYTVRIPMTHGVDSLNVAAASAVAFWQLRAK